MLRPSLLPVSSKPGNRCMHSYMYVVFQTVASPEIETRGRRDFYAELRRIIPVDLSRFLLQSPEIQLNESMGAL